MPHFFVFCPRQPWCLTFTFKLRRDFCTMYLTTKFHHHTFNRLEVIMLTNKLTNKLINWQTNRRRWKHPPRSTMLRRWVNIHSLSTQNMTSNHKWFKYNAVRESISMSDYVEYIQHDRYTVSLLQNILQQSSELRLQLSDAVRITA